MKRIQTRNPDFELWEAAPEDAHLVVTYMRKLGIYQKMRDKITATEQGIQRLLAEKKGDAVFGDYKGETVAFSYFCNNSSAFIGQSGIYIDGFYIDEKMRFRGLGKIMLSYLAQVALDRGCQRLEWGCLDWNEPSIRFYKDLGAYCVDIMRIYRFSPERLKEIAGMF